MVLDVRPLLLSASGNICHVLVTRSARKHGIDAVDIRRVLSAPLRTIPQGDVVLLIGINAERDLLEVVVAPGEPPTVVHAMRLRPANYPYLRQPAPLTAAAMTVAPSPV